MAWHLEFTQKYQKAAKKLDFEHERRILRFLMSLPKNDPMSVGRPLKGPTKKGLWKYRVGNYRVLVRFDHAQKIIEILKVGHRKEVYR